MLTYDPGLYATEIIDQQLGESVSGTPYWSIVCRITGRYLGGRMGPCQVGMRTVIYHVTLRSAPISDRALKVLGVSIGEIDSTSSAYTSLAGRRVTLRCAHREYQGVLREEWGIAPPPEAASSAAAKIADILAARAQQDRPAAPPPPNPPARPDDTDPVPAA